MSRSGPAHAWAEDLLHGTEMAMSEAKQEGRIGMWSMKKPDDEIAVEAPCSCRDGPVEQWSTHVIVPINELQPIDG